MEAAAGMGSPLICIDLGPLPVAPVVKPVKPKVDPAMAGLILLPDPAEAKNGPMAEEPPPPMDTAFVSQLNAAMDEVGRNADRYSCVVAFRSELASLASLKHAVTGVRCPWFGVDLDPACRPVRQPFSTGHSDHAVALSGGLTDDAGDRLARDRDAPKG